MTDHQLAKGIILQKKIELLRDRLYIVAKIKQNHLDCHAQIEGLTFDLNCETIECIESDYAHRLQDLLIEFESL